ncbi:Hypothetical predicted protein, partial [Paramuricea clavata]
MPTYYVIRNNLFTAQPNVQWTYSCPLDPMDKSNVHWTYLCPLDPMDKWNVHWTYACPMDPLDPMDHWTYSLCHFTGLLTCMGSMPTSYVIRNNLFTPQPNVQWSYSCPLDPRDKSNVHWTYLCPLDPMDKWNVHWTYACPMDPLDPMDHWTYSLCHFTGLLTCMGSMPTYYVIRNNLFTPQPNVQWTYSCPLDPMDKSNVLWTCLCPLDPMDKWNVHWTYACPMDPLDPMDHWIYSLCHLTGLLTCMGSMPTYDVIRNNLFTALPNVQWTYSMSIGSNGQVECPLDICMSNGSIGSNGPLDILPLPSH